MTSSSWTRPPAVLATVVLAMLSAGCGSRLTEDEVLAKNRIIASAESSSQPDGTAADPGSPASPVPTDGAGAPTGPQAAEPSGTTGDDAAGSGRPSNPSGVAARGNGSGATAPKAAGTDGQRAATQSAGTQSSSARQPAAGGTTSTAPPQGTDVPMTDTGPIVIGSVGNYSGPAGAAQAGTGHAVQAWAASVNDRGGLLGRQVRVIVVDDGSDPARHVAALRDLVENRAVVAFVGNAATLSGAAGRDYATKAGVPIIGTECTGGQYDDYPIYFNPCPKVSDQIFGLASGAHTFSESPKVALLYCSEAQICRDTDNFLVNQGLGQQAGIDIVYRAQVSLAQPDFTSECLNARNAGADVFITAVDPSALARIGSSCSRQGYTPAFSQYQSSVGYETNTKPGLAKVSAMTVTQSFANDQSAAAREFQAAIAKYLRRKPGPAESLGWTEAKLFELVATKAGTGAKAITPKTLLEALHTVSNETLGGLSVPLTFTGSGNYQRASCWFTTVSRDQKWTAANGGQPTCR